MRDESHFCAASSCKRLLPCHKVGHPPGDIAPDAGAFASEHGYFLLEDLVFCPRFSRRTNPFHTVDLESKLRGKIFHPWLLFDRSVFWLAHQHIPLIMREVTATP